MEEENQEQEQIIICVIFLFLNAKKSWPPEGRQVNVSIQPWPKRELKYVFDDNNHFYVS